VFSELSSVLASNIPLCLLPIENGRQKVVI
jgi:hypothetical protein